MQNKGNLVIIIGNGFDILHGMKTRYLDFSEYLIEEVIIKEFLSSFNNDLDEVDENSLFVKKELDIDNYLILSRLRIMLNMENKAELIKILKKDSSVLKLILSNELLFELYDKKTYNWFEIEAVFFKKLTSILKFNDNEQQIRGSVNKLNKEFELIKSHLELYLKKIPIENNQSVHLSLETMTKDYQNVYIVNFNYTPTVANYTGDIEPKGNIFTNFIHGGIMGKGNIIFGYGNDQDKLYTELRNSNIDAFLKHMKTFEYIRDTNYSRLYSDCLDRFNQYDVSVIGHSLGQTDKTLLNEILNSDKCKKINLFKRKDLESSDIKQKEEFDKLLYAASRIIEDDIKLRKRVVNFGDSIFFPN